MSNFWKDAYKDSWEQSATKENLIKEIIESHSGEDLLASLLAATKSAGAPDNVTIIWAEVISDPNAVSTYLLGAADE
jgi:hypothetical protein